MTTNNNTNRGISFFGLLQFLFIALKLTGHIDWAWWMVLAPTLIDVAIAVVAIAMAYIAICMRD